MARSSTKDLMEYIRPSASRWHMNRRSDILRKYPKEMQDLMRQSDTLLTVITVLFITVGHLYIAAAITPRCSLLVNFILAGSFGACFAFGFQALNHILMHSNFTGTKPLALLCSSACLIPWFSYYMSGGHARHHLYAGTERDIDREGK